MRRLVLLLVALAAACKSDEQKLSDELDRVSSWRATIAVIDSARAENRVPLRFAKAAIADANDEIAKSTRKIAALKARGVKPSK